MTFSRGNFTAFLTCWIAIYLNPFFFIIPCPQPTATIRLKPVAKDKEVRANPPAPTLLAPPARVRTGETMP